MAQRGLWLWAGLMAACAQAQTFGVGAGSTPAVQNAFVAAYQRGSFSGFAGAAIENVTPWGSGGLIQRFAGSGTTAPYALVKPDSTSALNVAQVTPPMYSYYSTVGAAVAGFPTSDTASCPALKSAAGTAVTGTTCVWQPFSASYAMFVFTSPIGIFGQTFATRGTIYTTWSGLGGVSALGPAESPEKQINSLYASGAIEQLFDQGVIYNMNFGPSNGKVFTVQQPIYAVYVANGAENGALGLPTGPVQGNPDGTKQQNFDRGSISYNASTQVATLQPSVAKVTVSLGAAATMYVGQALGATATETGATGSTLTGRVVTWTSSNTAVVQIQGTGSTVSLHAISPGAASVTAISEGQTSAALAVTVASCCQVGQGAPTLAIEQAFQGAVTRNNLTIQLPAAAQVTRSGNGYTQQVTNIGGATYLLTVADGGASGYAVGGSVLAQYLQLGGATGSFGYPVSDQTTGGRQLFQGGALAGFPAQPVTGAILVKWQALGYETGVVGSPSSAAQSVVTVLGTGGVAQSFQNGEILAAATGTLAGKAYYVTGLVLARYTASGGPLGSLGLPIGDERVSNGQQRQDFEGGYIYYNVGDPIAIESDAPRQPVVSITPGTARAGTPVHVVLAGFSNGASVRVSQTGQADFLVTAPNGTYAWDAWIPASAAAGVVTVKAVDAANSAKSASATYTVYTTAANAETLAAISGDQQTGPPGASLPLPLTVMLKDQNGNPIAGQTVTFAASPGGSVTPAAAVTDMNGRASASLRLPMAEGISLATATSGKSIFTFNEKSQGTSLANFPALSQNVSGTVGNGVDTIQNKGALLTAAAGILFYHQSRGELAQPNGLANPTTLNQFLSTYCAYDAQNNPICDGFLTVGASTEQTVNLWRLGAFVANSLTVQIEPATQNEIRDLIALGAPALLALQLGPLGSHYVVATGVAPDGSIVIADPNPAFAQTTLNGYLGGFGGVGQYVQATLAGVVRLLPQTPTAPGFLAAGNAAITLSTGGAACATLTVPGVAAAAGAIPAAAPAHLSLGFCDGTSNLYEMDAASPSTFNLTFTDLTPGGARTFLSGSGPAAYMVSRSGSAWSIGPLLGTVSTIVNAASFTPNFAPGEFLSVFGAGLAGSTILVNGQSATVVASTPFQVNAIIPATAAAGQAVIQVNSSNGVIQQTATISPTAPAIFTIGAGQAAITNQDNSLNTPMNPAKRGSYLIVYATGFGALNGQGAAAPVTAVMGGVSVQAAYAGASSAPGLNQANVLIPAALAPGLTLPFYLVQGGVQSNTVMVAIQ